MRTLFFALLLTIGPLAAQRPKPAYDPETADGLLIEHIQQETDAAQKLHYMEQFVTDYPKHAALPWVYDQLQLAYFQAKSWDQAMKTGEARLALEPENLDACKLALQAAEAKHDPAEIVSWADRVWPMATELARKGGPSASEAARTAAYAEFMVYSTAVAATDPNTRLELLQHLDQHMPMNQFAQASTAAYFETYRELGQEEKAAAMAQRVLQSDPGNPDMLLFLADLHARNDNPHDRQMVISFTSRIVESIGRAPRPAALSEQDWSKRKARILTRANYLGGVSESLNQNWSRADTMLRAAVAGMRENDAELGPALYHLGLANYRLAEAGHDRNRPLDALIYLRRCASIKSPFQEQAAKYIEGIRAEYNLP